MASTEELSQIGKGITLLVTYIPERRHAIVRFKLKPGEEPSEEEIAAIQFANASLPFDPEFDMIQFKRPANILIVPISVVGHYKKFGFKLVNVRLPPF